MKHKPMPDHDYLKRILDYNPDTGIFTYKVKTANCITIGQKAGYVKDSKHGKYVWIRIKPYQYAAHRLAYYYITKIDPQDREIDHINGNGLDNRYCNLRLAEHIQNGKNRTKQFNNTSGHTGVYKTYNVEGKVLWRVIITYNNKRINLGKYKSFIYACLIYRRAAKQYFGEFTRK